MQKLDVLLEGNWNDLSSEGELYAYMDRLFDGFMDSVRACLVDVSNERPRRRGQKAKACIRARRKGNRMHKQAWYDSECKSAAKVMHASTKWSDSTQRQRVCNAYRSLCRRKREAWLAERLREVDHVLNEDKSQMWVTVNHMLGIQEPNNCKVDPNRLREYYAKTFNVDAASADRQD